MARTVAVTAWCLGGSEEDGSLAALSSVRSLEAAPAADYCSRRTDTVATLSPCSASWAKGERSPAAPRLPCHPSLNSVT